MSLLTRQIRAELVNFVDLPTVHKDLLILARKVRRNAQAPYSHYKACAAALSETGQLHRGCNKKDSAYHALHAEESAISHMIDDEGPQKVLAVAVVAAPGSVEEIKFFNRAPEHRTDVAIDDLCVACAHCLQKIWENCLGDPNVALLGWTSWGEIVRTTMRDAYTMRFGPESLGIDIRKDSK